MEGLLNDGHRVQEIKHTNFLIDKWFLGYSHAKGEYKIKQTVCVRTLI